MTRQYTVLIKRSTLLHLRIPFSFLLMPVFFFSVAITGVADWSAFFVAFVAVHLFLYPASNGYNSYYDKDEESIGGLESPPPVDRELWVFSLVFDACALALALLVGWQFALALLLYGLVSKAYSHDKVRLKKRPVLSWLVVGFFQGAFMFISVAIAVSDMPPGSILTAKYVLPALLSSAMLMGSYPMTQVYQHNEDARRGDLTLSRMLGIKGTFLFTSIFFSLTMGGFAWYFMTFRSIFLAVAFFAVMSPVLIYFLVWFKRVLADPSAANYRSTMRLNLISAVCLNVFFFGIFLLNFW